MFFDASQFFSSGKNFKFSKNVQLYYCVLIYVAAQPPGQPEIIKKSLERCSVEGGVEMFIIGRNFHRGVKVVFQDPEETDGQCIVFNKVTFAWSGSWHLLGNLPSLITNIFTISKMN